MNAASRRVYDTLSAPYRHAFRAAQGTGDDDDLVQELALAQLSGRSPDYARSAARRFRDGGQGPRGLFTLDDERESGIAAEVADADDLRRDFGAIAHADKIAERFGVTTRRGYQLIAAQIRRAEACGDLFADAGVR